MLFQHHSLPKHFPLLQRLVSALLFEAILWRFRDIMMINAQPFLFLLYLINIPTVQKSGRKKKKPTESIT